MSSPVFVVHGAKQLRKTFKQAGQDLTDLKDVNQRTGDLVAGVARMRAPVRTGTLVASIRPAAAASRVRIRAGSAKVRWAQPIHWGWPARHIRPNPFITEAATSTESTWVGFYFAELQAIIDKVDGA